MQKTYVDQDPGPFVSLSGNPENGEWEEYANYVTTIENLSLSVAKDAYQRVCAGLTEETVRLLEAKPQSNSTDSHFLAHAKLLYRRVVALESGVIYERDGRITYRV